MRCIPGASHKVFGPLVRSAGIKIEFLDLLSVMALAIVIALAVGAAPKPGLRKEPLVQFALFAQEYFGFKDVDLAGEGFRYFAFELFFPQ